MIKNHPFQNGNKRIAVTTLFFALYENKKWIEVDTQTLYNFAVWVAESPSNAKEEVVRYVEKFIKKYMVDS
jgi:prophage maintenance system killer protein